MSAAERQKVQKYLNDVYDGRTGRNSGDAGDGRAGSDQVIEIEQEIDLMSCPFFFESRQ